MFQEKNPELQLQRFYCANNVLNIIPKKLIKIRGQQKPNQLIYDERDSVFLFACF